MLLGQNLHHSDVLSLYFVTISIMLVMPHTTLEHSHLTDCYLPLVRDLGSGKDGSKSKMFVHGVVCLLLAHDEDADTVLE